MRTSVWTDGDGKRICIPLDPPKHPLALIPTEVLQAELRRRQALVVDKSTPIECEVVRIPNDSA
jgi:hypothetical protein